MLSRNEVENIILTMADIVRENRELRATCSELAAENKELKAEIRESRVEDEAFNKRLLGVALCSIGEKLNQSHEACAAYIGIGLNKG